MRRRKRKRISRRMLPNMRYRYHCMKCRKWKRLNMKLEDYVRPPKCDFCGSRSFYRIKKRRQDVCDCPRYWFPHRFEPGKCGGMAEPMYGKKTRRGWAAREEYEDRIPF